MGSWKKTKWGEVATLEYGKALRDYDEENGVYPVYGTNGQIGWNDEPLVNRPGVIIGRKGAYRGVEYSDKPFCVIDTAFYLDLTTNEVLDKWAYYQLKDFDINNIDSGTAIPSTSREAFYQIPVEIPPLEQQKKIVDTLSAFDDLIENNSRRIEILEEMARRIYREWFVHFRYPDHENDELVDSRTELGEIPEGWEVKELEDFGEIVLGKTPSTKDSENYGDYMLFIKTPDMHDQFFIHETENVLSKKGVKTQEKKTLPVDSICVSCIGTAGVVAITSVPSQTNQQINSIVPEDKALREYLYFTTKALKPLMEKIGSTGATMTNVSKTKFKGLPALKPSQELLNKFHEKVGSLFDQISTLQKQNIKLKQTRDLLLPKLISGKIDMEEMELAI